MEVPVGISSISIVSEQNIHGRAIGFIFGAVAIAVLPKGIKN